MKGRMPHDPGKRRLRAFFILAALCASILFLEVSISFYIENIIHQGRLLVSDPVVGWRGIPLLQRTRMNADGGLSRIEINGQGYRGPFSWNPAASKRILILGDSFASGEGVDMKCRFDLLLSKSRPHWSIINRGVMGYGTDQALIAGRELFGELRNGDVLVLLTHGSDFFDILRRSGAGRTKPWFEHVGGKLTEHPPAMDWKTSWRDRSYLFSILTARFERDSVPYHVENYLRGLWLYRAIVAQETTRLSQKGVRVVLVFHGFPAFLTHSGEDPVVIGQFFRDFCAQQKFLCLELDPFLLQGDHPHPFLKDGHWNETGHEIAAKMLGDCIDGIREDRKNPEG